MRKQNSIVCKKELIPEKTSLLKIYVPEIAEKARPGNFVIIRTDERGERIPLTIADVSREDGCISLVFLVMGKSTALLNTCQEGECLHDVCGPLGRPTRIEKVGRVVCIGGGTGIAAMHHIAKGHAEAGNQVTAIIGARSRDLLLFEKELSQFVDTLLVCTDDGSKGRQGLVTHILQDILTAGTSVGEVVAVGPAPMMRAVSEMTRPFGVPTTVSLNSIMIDGIGMCGACRVTIGGQTRFACVDGPEFDGHQVDFDELANRLAFFKPLEKESLEQYHRCQCHEKK